MSEYVSLTREAPLLDLVTDRTATDVTLRNSKGTYNMEDLNRVEAATQELAAILTACGYPVTIVCKTDWAMTDFPTQAEMGRYLGNLKYCVAQYCAVPGVALPQSMSGLTYSGANDIEKVIQGIVDMVEQMKLHYRICGAFICGGV